MEILEIAAKMSGFRCRFCKGSLMKVHYPKLYNMAHLLALNVLLLPKDLTIIFILVSPLVGEPKSPILQNDRKIAPERPTAEFLYTGSLNSA